MDYQPNLYDKVVDNLHEKQVLVQKELATRFKKTKPFREEPVDNKEILLYYDQMSNDVNARLFMDTLIQRHGRETVNLWIADMESLKQKLGKNSANMEV